VWRAFDNCTEYPPHLYSYFQATLDTCIHNFKWSVPQEILVDCPILEQKLKYLFIHNSYMEDKLIWKPSHDVTLPSKDAYLFHASPHPQNISWVKAIWHAAIAPSKALLVWKILLNNLPTYDFLAKRGCLLPSICSLK